MKKLLKKDVKGIKIDYSVNAAIEAVNEGTINTYDMQGGFLFDAIMELSYYLLKNGMFEKSIYFEGNPFDFKRISWYLSDMFNATVSDTQRMLRSMDFKMQDKIMFSDRFGLNHFEILK